MGLGSVAKKAKSTVSKVAKKASPEQLKQKALGDIKQMIADPLGLKEKLGGLLEKLGMDPAQFNPTAIIRSIGN